MPAEATPAESRTRVATFGAGCFWCVEAVFVELKGVLSVKPGYMGGHVEAPTYEQVCGKLTGHAEVAHIEYDPAVIGFKELLEVFWKTHDPTTLNQQGADHGPQYRSAVYFHDAEQQRLAQAYKEALDASGAFSGPIVTEITEAATFWPAEQYHHDYYARNPDGGYCMAVIRPKIEKFRKAFAEKLKD
ncbi:MAG: peptide-methionine (S)-S-oxide reductase MsrA [Planctomycetota bacterium]|nr:peptide-methionine (S)-S-oxide reductase MsrA [Planctomycetota bacterium]